MVDSNLVSILIIDDHALFRSGLRLILAGAFAHSRITEAASIEAVLDGDAAPRPDVILLDIRLNGLSGLESIAILQRRWPETPVIMISSDADSHTVRLARDRGAAAFVSKADDSAQIIEAIRAVVTDGHLARAAFDPGMEPLAAKLTSRQCEVLHFLDQGLSNKLIARKLQLSENTVRGHVQAIMALLDSTSRAQAVYKARQAGLIA